MSELLPAVSVVIATKDRPGDLRRTLQSLRLQHYPAIEMIVIDDGSTADLEPIVRENWPNAVFIREGTSAGQCRRRSQGFAIARGDYLLQLDDDAYPVAPDALIQAVEAMEAKAEVGVLTFCVYNGERLPEEHLPRTEARYVSSFLGGAAIIRRSAVLETGGYLPMFGNEWEEEELSLRFMKAGWAIYFLPDIVVHHHVSPRNRRTERTWMRGLRNKLWALVMHFPLRRLPFEVTWTLAVACWDSIRLMRAHYLAKALLQFLAGLPEAIRRRDPMSAVMLRRYDALRFKRISTKEEYEDPPKCTTSDIRRWFRTSWWNRARQRSLWDRRQGDTGISGTVRFAHEFEAESGSGRDC